MKIGFHCWEFPPAIVGGLGTYAQCVTQALAKRGHELHVWAPEQLGWRASVPPIDSEAIGVRRVPLFDVTAAFPYVIVDELRSWGGFFSDLMVFNMQAAAETYQRRDLDVVAIQDWLSGLAGLMLARERPAPLVFHIHSTEWGRQPGGGSPAVHHFEGALGHEADAVVTVSETMREDLIAHGWDAERVYAVWNGVDPERYRPGAAPVEAVETVRRCYGIEPGATVLLFVGRLTAVKGVQSLIEAMPAVLRAQSNVQLIILGMGELQEPIRQRVHALGLENNVSLRYEFVDEDERIAHYAACDVAVFPSTYEPFGIVCLEAMAMGKPVVAGAQGVVGFREQVIPSGIGQTGLHVNGADPNDVAWGVIEMLRHRYRLPEWGANARQRVLDHFTWDHAAQKTEAVYAEAAKRFRRKA